ncbi:O-antigen ligase family protein [Listeria aquatica]|uniref:O-antigen ligase family protein n=1 Tax=Listeria aquatica TaxID=1494960 RepID=UPI003F6EC4A6
MKKRMSNSVIFFMCLVLIFPIVDIANGFLLTMGLMLPVGVLYRLFFFVFLIFSILSKPIPKSSYTLVTFVFVVGNSLIFLFQSIFLENMVGWIIDDFGVFVKYFLGVLISYFVYQQRSDFPKFYYEKLFHALNFLFILGLLVPYFLGVGTQTYEASNAGYKGYFFAQNDLSCAFIIFISFTGYHLIQKIKNKWDFSAAFILFLFASDIYCLLLIGMKTGVVYGLVIILYVMFTLMFGKNISILKRIIAWGSSVFFISWMTLHGINKILQLVEGTYNRMVYFYYLYDGNLVKLLTSSRSDFLEGGMNFFLHDTHLIFTLFGGQGFAYRQENFGRLGLIEMDFFDIFFGIGFGGVILFLIFIGYFIKLAFRKELMSVYSVILVVVLLYSFFAGHVFFSALSSTMFGLVCGGIVSQLKINSM